jgi:hypothetical protein
LIAVVPAVQAPMSLAPPTQTLAMHFGQGWMPASGSLSPVRKISDESGRLTLVVPVAQSTVPLGAVATSFRTQTLVGVLIGFGTVSGAPKRQPGFVQFLLLPVCVEDVPPTVTTSDAHEVIDDTAEPKSGTAYGSGTEVPPPPV